MTVLYILLIAIVILLIWIGKRIHANENNEPSQSIPSESAEVKELQKLNVELWDIRESLRQMVDHAADIKEALPRLGDLATKVGIIEDRLTTIDEKLDKLESIEAELCAIKDQTQEIEAAITSLELEIAEQRLAKLPVEGRNPDLP